MARGRPFPKGVSGNPGGRPAELGQFRALCRERTPAALRALEDALADEGQRVAAAKVLLEFGYGKPVQAVDLDASSAVAFTIVTNVKGE